jgi:hypothetical protein
MEHLLSVSNKEKEAEERKIKRKKKIHTDDEKTSKWTTKGNTEEQNDSRQLSYACVYIHSYMLKI